MNANQEGFVKDLINEMGYLSKQDLVENLFIKSLEDSYNRVAKVVGNENEIRNRFMKDLYKTDSEIRKWLQLKWIDLIWENWVFKPDFELARTDIAFKMTGLHFVIECKRLKTADKAYIEEGLERFISLKYAKGDDFAGMIGFVVAGDQKVICSKLKDKVEALDHTIFVSDIFPTLSFKSSHNRVDKTQISIHHLFFNFVVAE